ncbi:pyocin knob domain-containing protein, partial [Bilophila wadsworthia]|uniref:pyocin knob domain-containing protein n=1 Tax=Bilophila wadsworthia TaxID=35833 RepID=UPI00242F956D
MNQIPKISDLPEPPDRLVGDQERFDVLTFNSLKAQKKMVNEDLNKTLIPALNEFAVDVNASVDAAKASETSALASKNAAASSAATATTKAGEAAASAKAAKTSETSALASKNAASSSATAAANAQKAAEAARDEAQDLANVGYASESHAGLSKVDGKTTQADAGGVITVKDVAIGGNLGDLASARGQIGDAKEMPNLDFNTLTTPGNYRITGNPTNGPSLPLNISGASIGSLIVAGTLGQHGRIFQIMISGSAVTWRTTQNSTGATWGAWQQLLSGNKVGDGIRVTNGTISVPEYEGATASTAGTSGLVPPAAAGQQESFLT